MLDWVTDPTAYAGLLTLVVLELVLGIDNLVFVAILAQKLPAKQRDHARRLGLLLALGMRIALLLAISWLAGMTDTLVSVLGQDFSTRDVIMLVGGLFLLFKATNEIHDRLEGKSHRSGKSEFKAKFWMVIAQIVILDAVFSIDAVITAVGMVDHVSMMIVAVSLAILIMIWLSRPLTDFVNRHPTVVMLCLGFLLMVGFSLIAEGFGVHIPKGYLYAAIGFSVLIEAINQFARIRLQKRLKEKSSIRQDAADTILRILGARSGDEDGDAHEMGVILQEAARENVLSQAERELLRGVLNLSERHVHTIMTSRRDTEFINIRQTKEEIYDAIKRLGRSHLLVVDGGIDEVLGVLRKDDYMVDCVDKGIIPLSSRMLHEPLYVQKRISVMELLEIFKRKPVELAVVLDEFGSVAGVVTHLDLLEAIAGEFPHRDEPDVFIISENPDGSFVIDGATSIYDVRSRLSIEYEPDGRFATIAGLILHEMGRFPVKGDKFEWHGWMIEVDHIEGHRIGKVRLSRVAE